VARYVDTDGDGILDREARTKRRDNSCRVENKTRRYWRIIMRQYRLIMVFMVISLIGLTTALSGGVPQLINYNGRLTMPNGQPAADGDYQMIFTIYAVPEDGTGLWYSGIQTVAVEDGIFSYQLGSTNMLPDDLFSESTSRYLGIWVEGEEILPRTQLVTVPYAYHSLRADSAEVAEYAVLSETATYSNSAANADMVDNLHGSDLVQTSGDQTVDGTKTFNAIPVLPASDPVSDNQAARKAYVDGAITGKGWQHSGAIIYNAPAPSDWSTLDLSSYVGSNYAFVVIKVYQGARSYFKFKPYGSAGDWHKEGDADDYAANAGRIDENGAAIVCLETDSTGRLEWHVDPGAGNYILTLLGYIR
jgi:hypothetical protein